MSFLRLGHKRHCSFWFGPLGSLALRIRPSVSVLGYSSSTMEDTIVEKKQLPAHMMELACTVTFQL